MSLHRLAARRDQNEKPLVEYFAAHGIGWQATSIPGGPDGIACSRTQMVWVEFKQPGEKLRANQETWHEQWGGPAPWVIRTEADADMLIRWLREGR